MWGLLIFLIKFISHHFCAYETFPTPKFVNNNNNKTPTKFMIPYVLLILSFLKNIWPVDPFVFSNRCSFILLQLAGHFLTTILLEKDTFLHWMQSRITHHTYLSCRLSLLQTGDSCSHWASTSLQARLCRLPLNLGLPVDSSRYTTPEVTVPLPGYPVRRHDASLSLHWVRTGSASFLTVKFLFSYPMAICFKMM